MLVVGAVIVRNGRVLAGLRAERGWEFPGGKVESGESDSDALVRECREELGVDVRPVRELGSAERDEVSLRLWLVALIDAVPTASTDHAELRWVSATGLDRLDWLPLDRDLLPAIRPLLN